MVLPNFLVIGAQRCGTTLLDTILRVHEDIYVPPHRKEVHYFDMHFARGVDWYQSFFPAEEDVHKYLAVGEVTPDYIFGPEVPERIAALLPTCRLIVMLRNPVQRAFSGYLHHVRSFNERRTFAQFIEEQHDARQRGFYAQQIKRYLDFFPEDRMLIMLSEEVFQKPESELERLANFLHLSHSWKNPTKLVQSRVNRGDVPHFQSAFYYARRFGEVLSGLGLDRVVDQAKRMGVPSLFGRRRETPAMPAATRQWLQELYDPHIRELEGLLGRPIDVWRGRRSDGGSLS
jgi:hypothetical protein